MRAHPRSRGENRAAIRETLAPGGSSPLTRGKLRPGELLVANRLAHPRSRGENGLRETLLDHVQGSSPLTRGKRGWHHVVRLRAGLIPAHAGKTPPTSQQALSGGAHPRSRGENPKPAAAATCPAGSSPLTRGKRGGSPASRVGDRLIPAHAGKTFRSPRQSGSDGAHPRSRGENLS